jgi:hypothetical protein
MNATAFPATPGDVAALTVQEFTLELDELDGHRAASLERVCRTFMDDANRALRRPFGERRRDPFDDVVAVDMPAGVIACGGSRDCRARAAGTFGEPPGPRR